jgi:hypothetical protein
MTFYQSFIYPKKEGLILNRKGKERRSTGTLGVFICDNQLKNNATLSNLCFFLETGQNT